MGDFPKTRMQLQLSTICLPVICLLVLQAISTEAAWWWGSTTLSTRRFTPSPSRRTVVSITSTTPVVFVSTSIMVMPTLIMVSSSTRIQLVATSTKVVPSPSKSTLAPSSTSVSAVWSAWNVTCKEGGCCDENVAFNKNYTQHRTCLAAGNNCPSDAYGRKLKRTTSCPKKTSDCDGCKSGAANIQVFAGLVSTMLAMALVLQV